MITKFATFAAVVLTLFVFGAAFYSYANNAANNITPSITTSRYIMFGGAYRVSSELRGQPGTAQEENGVFKIDTYTGKAWILKVMVMPDGQRVEKWFPVSEE